MTDIELADLLEEAARRLRGLTHYFQLQKEVADDG